MTADALEAQAHNAAKHLGLIAIKGPEDVSTHRISVAFSLSTRSPTAWPGANLS